MNRSHRRVLGTLAAAGLSAALLSACGDAGTSGSLAGSLQLNDAWARTSPTLMDTGAAYLVIVNGTDADDALVGVTVDASVAAEVEMHETVAAVSGMAGASASGGMMEMRPVDRIEVPAGASVELKPGGYHLMLLHLAAPLETGTTIELTLTFERAGEKVVTADVRDTAP